MNNLILHALTAQQIEDFRRSPSHAVALIGPSGSGKSTLATNLATTLLQLSAESWANYPYKLVVAETDKALGIEQIRQTEHFLSLKVPTKSVGTNRVIIIEAAHTLTLEAQNALLKTLEEPPDQTLIILNVNHAQSLLPTIRSRVQAITIKRPNQASLEKYFKAQNVSEQQIKQAYAISGGLPGLMVALLGEADHPLLSATEKARQLLKSNTFERLQMIDDLAKQRSLTQDTLFILQQMARLSLRSATAGTSQKWQAVLGASFQASSALEQYAQPKLVLLDFVLSF